MSPLRSRLFLVCSFLPLLALALLPFGQTAVHASAKADRAAGQTLFHEKGCEHCHGVDGIGGEKGPSLAGVGRKLKPDAIQKQILEGGDAMPPFADVLAPDEVKLLVDYLSAKKKRVSAKAQKPVPPPTPKRDTGGSDDQ